MRDVACTVTMHWQLRTHLSIPVSCWPSVVSPDSPLFYNVVKEVYSHNVVLLLLFFHGKRKLGRVPIPGLGASVLRTLPIFHSFIEDQDSGVRTLQVDQKIWKFKPYSIHCVKDRRIDHFSWFSCLNYFEVVQYWWFNDLPDQICLFCNSCTL